MKVICCVCNRKIRETKEDPAVVSHTWCPSCLILFRVKEGLKKRSLKVRKDSL